MISRLTFWENGEESHQTVENPLPEWVDYFLGELFPKKINILGAIIVERYDHGFISVLGGYIPA